MFLTDADLRELTSFSHRSKQVAELIRLRIPFHVNAAGRPIVAKAILEGGKQAPPAQKTWEPSWAASHR